MPATEITPAMRQAFRRAVYHAMLVRSWRISSNPRTDGLRKPSALLLHRTGREGMQAYALWSTDSGRIRRDAGQYSLKLSGPVA
jgi:hypothetical protein